MKVMSDLENEQLILRKHDEQLSKFFDQVYAHQRLFAPNKEVEEEDHDLKPRTLYIYCGFGSEDVAIKQVGKAEDPTYIRLDIENMPEENYQFDRLEMVPEGDINYIVNGERYASYFRKSQMMFMRDLTHTDNKFAHEVLDKMLTSLEEMV